MPKTGSHLKIESFGDAVLGVRLHGDKRRPEPSEFRVAFPGGSITVARCTTGEYWAHVAVDHPECSFFDPSADTPHHITAARVDAIGEPVRSIATEGVYHVAVKVERMP